MLNLKRQLVLLDTHTCLPDIYLGMCRCNIYWKPVYSYISGKLFCSLLKEMEKKMKASILMICSKKVYDRYSRITT